MSEAKQLRQLLAQQLDCGRVLTSDIGAPSEDWGGRGVQQRV
jgi:hypothetical protein